MEDLRELLKHEVHDLYDAEKQLVEALPKLAQKATNPQLKAAIESHLEETEQHVERLKEVARLLGTNTGRIECMGMKGLVKEGDEVVKEAKSPEARDAGMIGAAQKVEHYEIAAYGTAVAHAQLLGENEAAQILEQTLAEERACDEKLSQIAMMRVNEEAA